MVTDDMSWGQKEEPTCILMAINILTDERTPTVCLMLYQLVLAPILYYHIIHRP